MSPAAPRYRHLDVLEETARPDHRLLVLAVGSRAYFLRRLDEHSDDVEPVETAWEIAGCEDATRLVNRNRDGTTRP
ncbi:hypothetical protein OG618_36915 (plasmid) [Kitasatospora sp. NBC_01246]|uniref:hypothetical protein n=1 Tax=Kitasatospora sp. NBC_01246 TaxID=2903570 RepID=UPI002E33D3F8|nr:hypothetical protein [Kitasatospora sp. NBC_01246]